LSVPVAALFVEDSSANWQETACAGLLVSYVSHVFIVVDCYPVHVSNFEEAGFFVPLLYLVLSMETSLM
jgi:hypothetical protein